jgi:DNA-binding LacI/PurR family transcriptional regulator
MFHAAALQSPGHYYGELLVGLNEALCGLGLPHQLVEAPAKWWEAPGMTETDGLIVLHPQELTAEEAAAVPLLRTPVVLIATQTRGVAWVDTDNRPAAANAVSYLANLGHRRIACITIRYPLTDSLHRVEGYRHMVARLGLDADPRWVVELDDDQSEAVWVERLGQLLEDGASRPTAVLANGYHLVLHAIRALQQLGHRVPDDVSVVGFDDPESAAHLTPPLTTISQPVRLLGALAAWKLFELRKTGRSQISGLLPCSLIVRGSCCPPRTA